jgi:hypothetical protein
VPDNSGNHIGGYERALREIQRLRGNVGAFLRRVGGSERHREGQQASDNLRDSNINQSPIELGDTFLYRQLVLTVLSLLLSYLGVWLWSSNRHVYWRWAGCGCTVIGLSLLIATWSELL